MIAQNLLSQVDEEAHQQLVIDERIYQRSNSEALLHDDVLYSTKNGNKCRKRTTKGWELFVPWKDGSSHWIALNYLNNSYPMEVADCEAPNKIQDQTTFACWVPYTLKNASI